MPCLSLAIEPLKLTIDWRHFGFFTTAGIGRHLRRRFAGFQAAASDLLPEESLALFPMGHSGNGADPELARALEQTLQEAMRRFPGCRQGAMNQGHRAVDMKALCGNRWFSAWIDDKAPPAELACFDLTAGWVVRRPVQRQAAVFLKTPSLLATKVASIVEAVYFNLSLAMPWQHALLLHGAGLIRPHGGLLVLGLSGAGKSTVARLAGRRHVIADDGIVVAGRKGSFELLPTPFNQQHDGAGDNDQRRHGPLRMGLFLKKDHCVKLVALAPEEACCRILKNHIHFFRFFDRPSALAAYEMVVAICRHVPFYELHFQNNPSFWPAVDAAMRTLTERGDSDDEP